MLAAQTTHRCGSERAPNVLLPARGTQTTHRSSIFNASKPHTTRFQQPQTPHQTSPCRAVGCPAAMAPRSKANAPPTRSEAHAPCPPTAPSSRSSAAAASSPRTSGASAAASRTPTSSRPSGPSSTRARPSCGARWTRTGASRRAARSATTSGPKSIRDFGRKGEERRACQQRGNRHGHQRRRCGAPAPRRARPEEAARDRADIRGRVAEPVGDVDAHREDDLEGDGDAERRRDCNDVPDVGGREPRHWGRRIADDAPSNCLQQPKAALALAS